MYQDAKVMKQEDKIKEFKSELIIKHYGTNDYIMNMVQEAIQFGSQLTAEAAREKVEAHIAGYKGEDNYESPYTDGLNTSLRIIEESIIGGDKK